METKTNLSVFLENVDELINTSYKNEDIIHLTELEQNINGEKFYIEHHEEVIVSHTSVGIVGFNISKIFSVKNDKEVLEYEIYFREDFTKVNKDGKVIRTFEIPYRVAKVEKMTITEEWLEI